jgi:hypothetical protein
MHTCHVMNLVKNMRIWHVIHWLEDNQIKNVTSREAVRKVYRCDIKKVASMRPFELQLAVRRKILSIGLKLEWRTNAKSTRSRAEHTDMTCDHLAGSLTKTLRMNSQTDSSSKTPIVECRLQSRRFLTEISNSCDTWFAGNTIKIRPAKRHSASLEPTI